MNPDLRPVLTTFFTEFILVIFWSLNFITLIKAFRGDYINDFSEIVLKKEVYIRKWLDLGEVQLLSSVAYGKDAIVSIRRVSHI